MAWCVVFWAAAVQAQDAPTDVDPRLTWVTVGAGGTTQGPAIALAVSHQWGPHLITVRGVGSTQFFGPSVGEIGLLYGRSTKVRLGALALSGGLGVVWGEPCGLNWLCDSSQDGAFTTLGVPLEVQWRFAPWSFLGVGISAVGDVNPRTGFVGVLLGVQFGRVR